MQSQQVVSSAAVARSISRHTRRRESRGRTQASPKPSQVNLGNFSLGSNDDSEVAKAAVRYCAKNGNHFGQSFKASQLAPFTMLGIDMIRRSLERQRSYGFFSVPSGQRSSPKAHYTPTPEFIEVCLKRQ